MGIYTELTKELLQKLEEETKVYWCSGAKPTEVTHHNFLIFNGGVPNYLTGEKIEERAAHHLKVSPEEFLSICKERLPKPKDDIKVGDWTVWYSQSTKTWHPHYIDEIKELSNGEVELWCNNDPDFGHSWMPASKCTKLYPYSKGEAKVGDKCVTLINLSDRVILAGTVVTIQRAGLGSEDSIDVEGSHKDHSGWLHSNFAPLPDQRKVETPVKEEVKIKKPSRSREPIYTLGNRKPCPQPNWLGKWVSESNYQVVTLRWDGWCWRDSYHHKLEADRVEELCTSGQWTKIEPGIDECPQVQPPKERYHIKYPLLAGILD